MALRKLTAIDATALTAGMMVRIVEPNGAAVPEVKAMGGGEMYARGAYGKVVEIPGGNGMGVKFDPTMLHDLQPKGYIKLTSESVVEPLEFDSRNDLLEAAAVYLNDYTDQAQPLLNSGRQAVIEAAVANITFEHDRLADLIEAAGYDLDKDIQAPIRNFGEGRLEREAERRAQEEMDAMRTYDGDGDDEGDEEGDDNVFHIGGPDFNPVANVLPFQVGTTDADGVVTFPDASSAELPALPNLVMIDVGPANAPPIAHFAQSVERPADANIPAGIPTIPEQTINVSTNHADSMELTIEDLDISEEGAAPRV